MALYPTLSEVPFVSIDSGMRQKVLKSNFSDLGKQQVKRKWLYPKRSVKLNYSSLTNTELREVEQFFVDRYGQYNAFTFIMPTSETDTYNSEYIGTGDGSTVVYNLPCISTSLSIYVDGNLQTISTNYTFNSAGGQDGVDSITFTTAPSSGVRVICNFTGRLAFRCRFSNNLEWSRIKYGSSYNTLSVELDGLLIDEG